MACVLSSSGNSDNLSDVRNATKNNWTGYNVEQVKDEEVTSELILYNSDNDPEINRPSYISYFNSEEFIETKLYEEDLLATIDTFEETDDIKVSFSQNTKDEVKLVEK